MTSQATFSLDAIDAALAAAGPSLGLGDAAELAGRHAARVFGAGTQRDETS